jgi:hypothetical protein
LKLENKYEEIGSSVFFGEFGNLANFLFKMKKRKIVIIRDFSPYFEIKIIKLATSRPTHFLGCHL